MTLTAHQLALPIEEFLAHQQAPGLPRQRRIFCNRNLRMQEITWVGFDMDYTLAIYNQAEMDALSIRATVEKLVGRGYPAFIRELTFATEFPLRGLLIDKRYGNILKMDRYKHVCKAFHGMRQLTREETRNLYHAKKLHPATPRFHWIDTLYALSEATLYSGLVSALEERNLPIDFGRVFQDIRESIDEAHRDGTIVAAVSSEFPRYVERDPDLAATLHKLRSAGKKLFLLTNSGWSYTEKMMTFLLGDAMTEYPTWRNYFDIVIASATKPAFFQERRPLMERDGDVLRAPAFPLERGRIYEGGNLHELERAIGVTGDAVLYVGDHIYGDILRSKKESAWRTAMIIQELETEVSAHESCRSDFVRSRELEDSRDHLEDELRFHQARFKDLSRRIDHAPEKPRSDSSSDKLESVPPPTPESSMSLFEGVPTVTAARKGPETNSAPVGELEAERARVKRALERIRGRLRQVDAELTGIERRIDQRFHPYWGSLLKEANEQSSFGSQVEEYACLYTSRVSNFFSYSPQQFYRSPRDEMPHELG